MRHRNVGLKLNRSSSHRDAMFRNMVTSLLKYERIRTTDVKAKEVRRWADHIITLAKRGDLHARRQAMAIVYEKDVVHKLFEEANTKFGGRQGGYTRIVKLGFRIGDAAPVSMIELVYDEAAAKPAKKAAKKSAPKTVPAIVGTEPVTPAGIEGAGAEPKEVIAEEVPGKTAAQTAMMAESAVAETDAPVEAAPDSITEGAQEDAEEK